MIPQLGSVVLVFLAWCAPALAAPLKIGDTAPPLKVANWIKGKPIQFGAEGNDKVYIVEFWATWCPPCRYEMPSMERAHQKVQGEDIVLLAVNVGESEDQVFEFTGQYPVSFPLLLDTDGAVIKKYPVIGLPTTFVIDPRGVVTHRAVGGREWDNEQLLGQLRKLLKPAPAK